uniref:estradiol 17-beta-dehydrogenase 8-like n=1 Tax=Styela clava TaxID=7725 RepID=UPI00193AB94C|nr:estradiol 17-beta-dehydrogenase 8-like [Styela clava]
MSLGRLVGKSTLVTGGGSGIGRAICQVFAREGASVAVIDINRDAVSETLDQLPRNHGNLHCAIEADVTSSGRVKHVFAEAKDKLSKTSTILVNNAGIIRGDLLLDMKDDDFDDVIRINLRGSFLMAREFLRSLKDATDINGSLVNIASIAGITGNFGNADYCASKHGVVGLTKSIALEYPKHKVRCNAVLPGITDTPMAQSFDPKKIEQGVRQIPMRRLAKPEEIANACLFFASDESSYVNGACLEVTGGLNV